MSILIGFFTVLLVLSSLFLILLILIQLPKKEAGMGAAFGGGATDALFGAGSGTALTHITKYTAATFLGLSLVLSVLDAHQANKGSKNVLEKLQEKAKPGAAVPVATPASLPATNSLVTTASNAAGAVAPVPAIKLPAPVVPAAPAK